MRSPIVYNHLRGSDIIGVPFEEIRNVKAYNIPNHGLFNVIIERHLNKDTISRPGDLLHITIDEEKHYISQLWVVAVIKAVMHHTVDT